MTLQNIDIRTNWVYDIHMRFQLTRSVQNYYTSTYNIIVTGLFDKLDVFKNESC